MKNNEEKEEEEEGGLFSKTEKPSGISDWRREKRLRELKEMKPESEDEGDELFVMKKSAESHGPEVR